MTNTTNISKQRDSSSSPFLAFLSKSSLETNTLSTESATFQPKVVIEDCSLLIEAAQPLLDPRPENLHSSDPQLVKDESFLKSLPVKVKINWPSMTDGDEWNKFNTNVFKKLVPVHSISDRVSHLENIIYEEASSLFGHITEESKLQHRYNFKKKRIIELVNTKNSILDQLSSANSEHDIVGLQSLILLEKNCVQLGKKIIVEKKDGLGIEIERNLRKILLRRERIF